jgi:hypothetical protein
MEPTHSKTIPQIENGRLTVGYCGFGMRRNNKEECVPGAAG